MTYYALDVMWLGLFTSYEKMIWIAVYAPNEGVAQELIEKNLIAAQKDVTGWTGTLAKVKDERGARIFNRVRRHSNHVSAS